jgi:hypothetical protein
MLLEGKTAIVCGGGGGDVGWPAALAFARERPFDEHAAAIGGAIDPMGIRR